MLPESLDIGPVTYSVVRDQPSPDSNGFTDWANARIAVAPFLEGEVAVGVFVHEVTHALAYTVGQHNDNLKGEEYVSTVGHVLHEFSRANPEALRYLIDPDAFAMPGEITMFPYTLEVKVVTRDELDPDEHASVSLEDCTLKVRGGLQPQIAAWAITHHALSFGVYRLRATETGDRYEDPVAAVAGVFIDALRRNPALAELLTGPIQRPVGLELVVNNDAGPTLS